MLKCKTRAEKRDELIRKKKIKAAKGASLAGQVLRTRTNKKFINSKV